MDALDLLLVGDNERLLFRATLFGRYFDGKQAMRDIWLKVIYKIAILDLLLAGDGEGNLFHTIPRGAFPVHELLKSYRVSMGNSMQSMQNRMSSTK